jgi:hypothetical protein
LNRLSQIVDALDRVSPSWLLALNGVLALLVLVAHGGWLLLVHTGKGAATAPDVGIAYVSIPLAALALLLAVAGVALPSARVWALRAQAVLLLLLLLYLLQFAWSVIADGAPVDGRFSWNPVLFAFVVAYPVYLARRVLFPTVAASQGVLRYSHVIALFVSVVISALVLYRAAP